MARQMRVSLIQMDMEFCQPEHNYAHAEELVRDAAWGADVVVLPEMWNTGFFPREKLEALCDWDGQRTKTLMGKLAAELSVNIVAGSVVNKINRHIYNSAYIFDRTGKEAARYDKIHLFSPMGEDSVFQAGDHISVFELDGIRCGIIICYDIRFPELTRAIALKGIDVLFAVSQWPAVRLPHVDVLTQARAIENQVFLAYTNAWATAGETIYGGHSALIDPLGGILCRAEDRECILRGTLELDLLKNVRETINVYRDRRPEVYQIN